MPRHYNSKPFSSSSSPVAQPWPLSEVAVVEDEKDIHGLDKDKHQHEHFQKRDKQQKNQRRKKKKQYKNVERDPRSEWIDSLKDIGRQYSLEEGGPPLGAKEQVVFYSDPMSFSQAADKRQRRGTMTMQPEIIHPPSSKQRTSKLPPIVVMSSTFDEDNEKARQEALALATLRSKGSGVATTTTVSALSSSIHPGGGGGVSAAAATTGSGGTTEWSISSMIESVSNTWWPTSNSLVSPSHEKNNKDSSGGGMLQLPAVITPCGGASSMKDVLDDDNDANKPGRLLCNLPQPSSFDEPPTRKTNIHHRVHSNNQQEYNIYPLSFDSDDDEDDAKRNRSFDGTLADGGRITVLDFKDLVDHDHDRVMKTKKKHIQKMNQRYKLGVELDDNVSLQDSVQRSRTVSLDDIDVENATKNKTKKNSIWRSPTSGKNNKTKNKKSSKGGSSGGGGGGGGGFEIKDDGSIIDPKGGGGRKRGRKTRCLDAAIILLILTIAALVILFFVMGEQDFTNLFNGNRRSRSSASNTVFVDNRDDGKSETGKDGGENGGDQSSPTSSPTVQPTAAPTVFDFTQCGIRRRKAWRKMTCNEQNEFMNALQQLKDNGMYHEFIRIHSNSATTAHVVDTFLPWHRWYLYAFETALQQVAGYCITIPYWDWDATPTTPNDTVLKSTTYGTDDGGEGGCVEDGFMNYFDWIGHGGEEEGQCIRRIYNRGTGYAISEEEILSRITTFTDYDGFRHALEGAPHSNIHFFFSGTMLDEYSPNDAIFWLHHVNIDRIWALWQDYHQHSHVDDMVDYSMEHYSDENIDDPMIFNSVVSATATELMLNPYTGDFPTPREVLTNRASIVDVHYIDDRLACLLQETDETYQTSSINSKWIQASHSRGTSSVQDQCPGDTSNNFGDCFALTQAGCLADYECCSGKCNTAMETCESLCQRLGQNCMNDDDCCTGYCHVDEDSGDQWCGSPTIEDEQEGDGTADVMFLEWWKQERWEELMESNAGNTQAIFEQMARDDCDDRIGDQQALLNSLPPFLSRDTQLDPRSTLCHYLPE